MEVTANQATIKTLASLIRGPLTYVQHISYFFQTALHAYNNMLLFIPIKSFKEAGLIALRTQFLFQIQVQRKFPFVLFLEYKEG